MLTEWSSLMLRMVPSHPNRFNKWIEFRSLFPIRLQFLGKSVSLARLSFKSWFRTPTNCKPKFKNSKPSVTIPASKIWTNSSISFRNISGWELNFWRSFRMLDHAAKWMEILWESISTLATQITTRKPDKYWRKSRSIKSWPKSHCNRSTDFVSSTTASWRE